MGAGGDIIKEVQHASSVRNCRKSAHAVHECDKRRAENRWTRSRTQTMQAVRARMTASPAQTCFGYARCAAAIHLEFQPPKTPRQPAARERFRRRRALAILAISNDAEPIRRSPLKMFFLEKATRWHRPATPLHLSSDSAVKAPPQKRGCTRCSSLAPRVSSTPPSRHRARRQPQEHARPIPCRTKSMEALAFASSCASTTKRKTSSRIDSKKHVQSAAQEKTLPHAFEEGASFSELDYRRPAQTLAIATAYRSIGRIRRNEAANWSALYAEGFSSWRKSSLMAARTSSALLGFASLLYAM
jgi:hypothetical protein